MDYNIDIALLLIDLCITLVVYLFIPVLIRYVFHKRYNKRTSIYRAVYNVIFGYIVFVFLYCVLRIEGIPKIPVAIFYGYISYFILHDGKLDKKLNNANGTDKNTNNIASNKQIIDADVEDTKVDEVLQDTSDRITEIKSEDIKHATTKKANKRGLFANKWRILGMVSIVVNVCLIGSLVFVYLDDRQDIDDLNDTVKALKKSKSDVEARNSKLINENWNMRSKVNFFDEHVVIVPNNTRVYHRYDCFYCDKSSFLIFNDENAKAMGYRACSHCMK